MKETLTPDPMFMLTGIEDCGFTNETFLEELERLNNEVVEELGYTVKDKIQVISKRKCYRNPAKSNWILQAKPEIAKWFLRKGRIFFNLLTVHVQEHLNLAQCFKCCGFGHVSKYCSQEECCFKCGGKHSGINCIEALNCPNCTKMKIANRNHSARDQNNCEIYKRKLLAYRNNVKYNDFL